MSAPGDGPAERMRGETGRLCLRALDDSDEALFCELFSDAEIMRFIGPPWSRERAIRGFSAALAAMRHEPPPALYWAVVEKASSEAIGIGSMHRIDPRERRAEYGLMLKKVWRTQGRGKKATCALIERAFELLPVDEIRASIAAEHAGAGRVLRDAGFTRGATTAAPGEPAGHVWSVRRDSWRGGHAGPRVAGG